MLKSKKEYEEALEEIKECESTMKLEQNNLKREGWTEEQIKRAMNLHLIKYEKKKEEISRYKNIMNKDIGKCSDLNLFGQYLIAIRLCLGLSQKEFAEKIDVRPSQLSRDESNEYSGISMERAQKILDKIGAKIYCSFELPIECKQSNFD